MHGMWMEILELYIQRIGMENLLFVTECIGRWQKQSIHQQSFGI